MAHRQPAAHDILLHRARQAQQAQGVGHRRAVLADPLGHLVLGEVEAAHQVAVGLGLLDRVEILALDVLDQRHFQGPVLGDVLDDHRDVLEPGPLGGPPAPLAGDDLIMVAGIAHHQRLDHPLLADRGDQFRHLGVVEALARLPGVRAEFLDRAEEILVAPFLGRRGDQGADPLAEGGSFGHDSGSLRMISRARSR